jgi:hypothetical protein
MRNLWERKREGMRQKGQRKDNLYLTHGFTIWGNLLHITGGTWEKTMVKIK